jgi:glycosyltransferase 2 family protein
MKRIVPELPAGAAAPEVRPWKRRSLVAGKWLVSVSLIALVLSRVRLDEVLAIAVSVDIGLLVIAFALLFVGVFISSSRWRVLLRAQGIEAPRLFLYRAFLVGTFFNHFFPSTVGGDAVRAYDSWRLGANRAAAVAVIFVDRFLGVIALTLFALAALPGAGALTSGLPLLRLWIAAALAIMAVVVLMIFAPPRAALAGATAVIDRLPRLARRPQQAIRSGFARFRGRGTALRKGLAWSIVLQLNVVLYYFAVAAALDLPITLSQLFLVVPLSLFVMSLPITINGIGVRESVFVFFFAVLGIPSANAVAFAWVAYALMLLQGVIGGVIYALRDNRSPIGAPRTDSDTDSLAGATPRAVPSSPS